MATTSSDDGATGADSDVEGADCFAPARRARNALHEAVVSFAEEIGEAEAAANGGEPAYRDVKTPDGKWTVAYDEGEVQWMRIRRGPRHDSDDTYIVSQYGKPSVQDYLSEVIPILRFYVKASLEVLSEVPDEVRDFIDSHGVDGRGGGADAVEALRSTPLGEYVRDLEDAVEEVRQTATLADVRRTLEQHDRDAALTILGDEQDDREAVDKMLTYWKDNEPCDTDLTVPLHDSGLMVVRAVRYYEAKDKYYPVGYVVGYDDTDARFFIHRLNWSQKLDDEDHDWTLEEVREMMGFDRDIDPDEAAGGEVEYGTTYRVQGDLTMVRSEYESAREAHRRQVERDHRSDYEQEYVEEWVENHAPDVKGLRVRNSTYSGLKVNTTVETETDALKDLQERLGIDEEDVRAVQDEHDDWTMLTAKRRKEAIKTLVKREFYDWCANYIPVDDIEREVDAEMREEWDETQQVNLVIGNHLCILSDATVHPNSSTWFVPMEVVVPDGCELFVIHDEHQQKQLTLDEGVYTFDFLTRHQNA